MSLQCAGSFCDRSGFCDKVVIPSPTPTCVRVIFSTICDILSPPTHHRGWYVRAGSSKMTLTISTCPHYADQQRNGEAWNHICEEFLWIGAVLGEIWGIVIVWTYDMHRLLVYSYLYEYRYLLPGTGTTYSSLDYLSRRGNKKGRNFRILDVNQDFSCLFLITTTFIYCLARDVTAPAAL